jgi:hypothetical protein
LGRQIEAGLMLAKKIRINVFQISNLVPSFPKAGSTTVTMLGGGN